MAAEKLTDTPLVEVGLYWWVAPNFEQSEIGRKKFLAHCPFEWIAKKNEMRRLYRLLNGSEIQFKSADNPDSLRGEGLSGVIVDEGGIILRDDELWDSVLRPALTDKQGWAWFLGTPKGKNRFWQLFNKGRDPLETEWASWQFESFGNPWLELSERAKLEASSPGLVFQQEILAQFIDAKSIVFGNFTKCIGSRAMPPIEGTEYYGGLDLAKYQDFTVFSIFNCFGRQVFLERFPHIDWNLQIQKIEKIMQDYFNPQTNVDSTGVGDPIFEELARLGLNVNPIQFGKSGLKQQVIDTLVMAFENQTIQILDNPIQTAELSAYEYELTGSGAFRYNAPSGQHDDIVIADALAVFGLKHRQQPVYLGVMDVS